ncbi:hypothetical protein BJ742DRAFT_847371 [Cladochytrium replicatum]|nr:hypothetical protein BJ742DRAFT_847371 [Cladochytrium replicatum]
MDVAPPAALCRVFLAVAPLRDAFGQAFSKLESSVTNSQRAKHAAVFILWNDKMVRYELLLDAKNPLLSRTHAKPLFEFGSYLEAQNKFEEYLKSHSFWDITEVGWTSRSQEEARQNSEAWGKRHVVYNSFIDNCRTFADEFTVWVVTHDPAWHGKVGPARSNDEVVAPVRSFATPLEYVTWRRKKLKGNRTAVQKRTHSYNAVFGQDGRLNIDVSTLTDKPGEGLPPYATDDSDDEDADVNEPATPYYGEDHETAIIPRLNIVILIVGSRGDVQPFVALGKELKKNGHRVRLATHETFRSFVKDGGLEFYPLGGDPTELMAYMVKNPGLLPGFESIWAGDIQKKRSMMKDVLSSCWSACVEKDDETGREFVADAIIANPPSFGHIHCAERLMVPLHIFFTMPYSPTTAFPHPLTTISQNGNNLGSINYFSYDVVEMITWQGIGDIINDFRRHTLGLDELYSTNGPYLLKDLLVPHTYIWSPSLIPKPRDWGSHIDICGFFFLDLATNYTPDPTLQAFLDAGDPPVYIGFGSIVVDDPDALTKTVFDAVERAGVRAIVSKGWGGIGGDTLKVSKNVFMIGNVPHDWLFQHVVAVVHHGGAGTTAAGLRAGKPTVIVPFFGDQPFWGSMVKEQGVGPAPIPHAALTADKLSDAIRYALSPNVREAAHTMSIKLSSEDGLKNGVRSFHKALPLRSMTCDIDPSRIAAYYSEDLDTKLSAVVAAVLARENMIDPASLKPYGGKFWNTEGAQTIVGTYLTTINATGAEVGKGITGLFTETGKAAQTFFSNPGDSLQTSGKGLLKIVNMPLKASGKLVGRLADSMRKTASDIEGVDVAPAPVVTDASTGLQEGLKSFGKGLAGMGAMVVKPYQGAVNEGIVGAGKGFVDGLGTAVAKPIAGTLDLVYLSGKGIVKSTKSVVDKYSAGGGVHHHHSSSSSSNSSTSSVQKPEESNMFIPFPTLPPRIVSLKPGAKIAEHALASEVDTERMYLQVSPEASREIVSRFMARVQWRKSHVTAVEDGVD